MVGTYGVWTSGLAYGIFVDDAVNVAVTENAVTQTHYGIRVRSSDGVVVHGNTVFGNGTYAIYILGTDEAVVQDNLVNDNAVSGIRLRRSNGSVVRGNTVTTSERGLVLDDSSQNTVLGNTISGNEEGIVLGQLVGVSSSPSNDNTIQDNTITGNTMLLQNPHLSWITNYFTYYEAHLVGPDFEVYGATQIGLPIIRFAFNQQMGISNTVNGMLGYTTYKLTLKDGAGGGGKTAV